MTHAFAALSLALAVVTPAPAQRTEHIVRLMLDGRPVDRGGVVAVARDGVVYADVVDLVKTFDGLLTFQGNAVVVSVRANTATFTAGSRTVRINQGSVVMPGQTFKRDGEVFVPLETFVRRVAGAKLEVDPDLTHADISVNAAP